MNKMFGLLVGVDLIGFAAGGRSVCGLDWPPRIGCPEVMRGSVFTSTGELNLLDELPTRTKYLPAGRTRLRLKS